MPISKASILAEVNSRTARLETNIDSLLKAVLLDLTIDFPFLKGEFTASTIKGQPDYTLSNIQRIVTVVKIDNNRPLNEINTWEEYQALIAEETESNWNTPDRFIVNNRVLYLYPTPNDTYTLTIFSSCIEKDVDSIELDDNFEEVINSGCEFMLYRSKGLGSTPAAVLALQLYEKLKESLKKIYTESAQRVDYQDI